MKTPFNKVKFFISAVLFLAMALGLSMPMQTARAATPVVYVKPDNKCGGKKPCYTTIQAGVNAVDAGGTVNVAAGTYVEAVNVTKPLTLKGSAGAKIKPDNTTPMLDNGVRRVGVYINAVDNVTVDGFEIDGKGGTVHLGVYAFNSNNTTVKNNVIHHLLNDANNVAGVGIIYYGWGQAIDNALIQGNTVSYTDHHGIWIGAVQADGVTPILSSNNIIEDNTVHHTWQNTDGRPQDQLWGGAIGMDAAHDATIHGNSIDNTGFNMREIMLINGFDNVSITDNTLVHYDGADAHTVSWMQPAIEIASSTNSNLAITGNSITVNTKSSAESGWVVWLPDVAGNSSFNNNTITLTGRFAPGGSNYLHGLVFGYTGLDGNWTVQGNTFQGGNLGANSTGIRLYDWLPPTSAISISGNLFKGWATGIRTDALANAGLVTVNFNNITHNSTYGVLNDGSAVAIDATCNWWGAANGPGPVGPGKGDKVSTNVTFVPWLISPAPDGLCGDGGPLGTKQGVTVSLFNLLPTGDKNSDKKIQEAINKIQKIFDASLWVDASQLDPKHGNQFFDREKDAVNKLNELLKDKHSKIPTATLKGFIGNLIDADRALAQVAINAAAGGDPKEIDKANEELAKGDIDLANSKYGNAIEHYRLAWQHAQHAMP
jgi:hypothetical protein